MATTEAPKRKSAQAAKVNVDGLVRSLSDIGRDFHRRGWSLATSSNYSVVLEREPLELLITASGRHKDRLAAEDFVRIDVTGQPMDPTAPKSSAESLLHVVVAAHPGVGAVLHTHSVWANVLSERFFTQGGVEICGYEMLKGLEDVGTHEYAAWLPIFDNTQDIPELADKLASVLSDPVGPVQQGFLIRRHGLYTWGHDLDAARRHVETIEFLLECVGRQLVLESVVAWPRDHIVETPQSATAAEA